MFHLYWALMLSRSFTRPINCFRNTVSLLAYFPAYVIFRLKVYRKPSVCHFNSVHLLELPSELPLQLKLRPTDISSAFSSSSPWKLKKIAFFSSCMSTSFQRSRTVYHCTAAFSAHNVADSLSQLIRHWRHPQVQAPRLLSVLTLKLQILSPLSLQPTLHSAVAPQLTRQLHSSLALKLKLLLLSVLPFLIANSTNSILF